jgi:hypothetical protein
VPDKGGRPATKKKREALTIRPSGSILSGMSDAKQGGTLSLIKNTVIVVLTVLAVLIFLPIVYGFLRGLLLGR